jgi:uncharacterized protein YndB with AHSA1/START domain
MQHLDLKFVCRHGEFIGHRMAGREEIAGRDVILVHRLLKNAVNERLGGHACALCPDACIRAMGVDPAVYGLVAQRETIDVIGEVTCWVRDLEAAWRQDSERERHEVTSDRAAMVIGLEFAAPRPTVWECFTVPALRPKWRGAGGVREATRDGRRGVGTTNHCMRGEAAIIEEVLDWRPFDYLTLTTLLPVSDAPVIVLTYAFFDTADGGTRVEIRAARPKPKDRALPEHVGGEFRKAVAAGAAKLAQMLAGQPGEPAAVEEPALPASAARFLTQQVQAG